MAQVKGLMTGTTNNPLKTARFDDFMAGIGARCAAYESLYRINSSRTLKKLKFACRIREEKTIDKIIDCIIWGGTVTLALGIVQRLQVSSPRHRVDH